MDCDSDDDESDENIELFISNQRSRRCYAVTAKFDQSNARIAFFLID